MLSLWPRIAVVAGLVLLPGLLTAQEAPIVQDTYVVGTKPTSNFGTRPVIRISNGGPRIGYLQFDVSAFVGQSISSAILTVTVSGLSAPGEAEVTMVQGAWSESSLTYSNRPLSIISSPTPKFSVGGSDVGLLKSVDVTHLVQQWADGRPNYGFILDGQGAFNFSSKEGSSPARLYIQTGPPPEPPTWPEVDCPCDPYYTRAVQKYISEGGSLGPVRSSDGITVTASCTWAGQMDPPHFYQSEMWARLSLRTSNEGAGGSTSLNLSGEAWPLSEDHQAWCSAKSGSYYHEIHTKDPGEPVKGLTRRAAAACAVSILDLATELECIEREIEDECSWNSDYC